MKKATYNPWENILQGLEARAAQEVPPRTLSLWQLYMHKKKAEIQEEFNQRWEAADLPDAYNLSFRCKIARELLKLESPEYVAELELELKETSLEPNEAAEGEGSGDDDISMDDQEQ